MAGTAIVAVLASAGSALAQDNSDLQQRVSALEAEVQQSEMNAAQSANAAPPPAAHVGESGAHKFSLVSADGDYSIALTGRIHLDAGDYVDFTPKNPLSGVQALSSGFNARRARIGVAGKLAGDWSYQFIYDGGNSQDSAAGGIEWAQVSYNGWKGVIVDLPGYSEPAFTLDTATSSNEIMFMERATPANLATSVNTGDFRANTGIRVFGDRYWFGAYLTGPSDTGGSGGDSHTNVLERLGAFQRATVQVVTGDNYSVHLGAAVDELLQAPNSGVGTAKTITISDRPELRIDPTAFLSTGALGTVAHPVEGTTVYNAEAAIQYSNIFAQGEYFVYDVGRRGLKSADFDGAYGQIAWTLTGEHRNYLPATGAYSAIVPDHPFSMKTGDWGAWEIAARYSYATLTDQYNPLATLSSQPQAVNGGKQSDFTLGVNWYVNSYMRFMFNYVHSNYSKANGAVIPASGSIPATPLGAPVGMSLNAIALRTQIAF